MTPRPPTDPKRIAELLRELQKPATRPAAEPHQDRQPQPPDAAPPRREPAAEVDERRRPTEDGA